MPTKEQLEAENAALRELITTIGELAEAPLPADWADAEKFHGAQLAIATRIATVCKSDRFGPAIGAATLRRLIPQDIKYTVQAAS